MEQSTKLYKYYIHYRQYTLHNIHYAQFTIYVLFSITFFQALLETEENLTYLKPLLPYLQQMVEESGEEESLLKIIAPMMCIIELIWKHSKFYHEPKNFKRLLKHLSYLAVATSEKLVGGEVLGNSGTAYINIKHALKLCATFRGCYLDRREKANEFNKAKVTELNDLLKSSKNIEMVTGPFISISKRQKHMGTFISKRYFFSKVF